MEPALFFDGQTSRRHTVRLAFGDRLEIFEAEASGAAPLAAWPYEAVRRADGAADTLRLACTTAPPLARLELRDPAAQADIVRLCRNLDGPGSAATVSARRITIASLAAGAAILGIVWFGVPLVADRLAAALPIAWEQPLVAAIDPRLRRIFGAECAKPAGIAALRKLVGELQSIARLPISPDPVVLRSNVPNAFAVPGGRVYLLSGLLAKAEAPDELAGVLAHELGHVAHRDALRRLIRDGGTSLLIGMLFGDVTGSGAVLMAGRAVLSASYTRGDEARADAFAITVMHGLGRPTAPLGTLLQRITGNADSGLPSILRDHPLTPDRMAMLNAASAPPTGPVLLGDAEWQDLRSICDR